MDISTTTVEQIQATEASSTAIITPSMTTTSAYLETDTMTVAAPTAKATGYSDAYTSTSTNAPYQGTTLEQGQTTLPTPMPVSSAYLDINTISMFASAPIPEYLEVTTSITTVSAYPDTTIATSTVAGISTLLTGTNIQSTIVQDTSMASTIAAIGLSAFYLTTGTSTQSTIAQITSTFTSMAGPDITASYPFSGPSIQWMTFQVTSIPSFMAPSAPKASYLFAGTSSSSVKAQTISTHNSKNRVQIMTTTLATQPLVTLSTTPTTTAPIGMLLKKYAPIS